MNSFFIELSSNSRYLDNDFGIRDDKLHPFNTIGNFRNKIDLLHPLEGDWEIAIAEISYTKSWRNLTNSCYMRVIEMFSDEKPPNIVSNTFGYLPQNTSQRHGIVRAGYYDTVKDLCKEINEEMKVFEIKKSPEFCFDEITKHVFLKPGINDDKYVLPTLHRELSQILGFDFYSIKKPIYNEDHYILTQRPADITGGIHTLYVYCNLITPQYIGDVRAKLLKTVEIPNNSKFSDQIVISYSNPHYVPIIINDFEEIEIDIKDDSNQQIKFLYGRTRIKLHLKRCHI